MTRVLIEDYLQANNPSTGVMAEAIGLAISSAEYQWFRESHEVTKPEAPW